MFSQAQPQERRMLIIATGPHLFVHAIFLLATLNRVLTCLTVACTNYRVGPHCSPVAHVGTISKVACLNVTGLKFRVKSLCEGSQVLLANLSVFSKKKKASAF